MTAQKVAVFGDADFIAIFEKQSALPDPSEVQCLCRRAEAETLKRGVQCKIGVGVVRPQFLRTLKPSIFSYELLTFGDVVWGDAATLTLIPPMSPSDIPLEDAWRTLCNRMIELLEVSYSEPAESTQIPLEIQYRLVKLWLDMATSFLLFADSYAPTYSKRERNLRTLAATESKQNPWPFSPIEFSSIVTRATTWRISGVDVCAQFSEWRMYQESVKYARMLWRWELCRLTGSRDDLSDRQLCERWMRTRPVRLNIRGWLHALRKRGCRSWRYWPRWVSLGLRASPRYWIYRAAGELLFHPSTRLTGGRIAGAPKECDQVYNWLLENPAGDSVAVNNWRALAADIVWNYKEFLVDTRS
ncbi:MAG: hypothetical protein WAM04_20305 [Candidatus Sulfotelmatobacter sp.]